MPTPISPFASFTPSGEVSTNLSGAFLAEGSNRTSSQSAAMSSRCGMTCVTRVFMSADVEMNSLAARRSFVGPRRLPAFDPEGVGDDTGAGFQFRFELGLEVAGVRLRRAVDVDDVGVGEVVAIRALEEEGRAGGGTERLAQ